MMSLLLVLLPALVDVAGADHTREQRRTHVTSLELTATISRSSWTFSERPLISLTLTNLGTDALLLPARISYGEGTPEVERHPHNAWVTVVNQRGKELEEECHLDTRGTGERSYRVLSPGQSTSWTMLIYCRNWGHGGEFFATAHLWNRESEPPPPDPAAKLLREKIDSNQVSFSMRKRATIRKR